jgi:hypothetical protein
LVDGDVHGDRSDAAGGDAGVAGELGFEDGATGDGLFGDNDRASGFTGAGVEQA